MVERGGGAAPEPAVPLCAGTGLAEAGLAHVFDVLEYGRPARAFVLRFEGRVVGYLNRCLHVPAEMDWLPGQFLDADKRFIVCSIHGATYTVHDGRCIGGPCARGRLKALALEERADGQVYWYPSADIRPVLFEEAAAPPASTP